MGKVWYYNNCQGEVKGSARRPKKFQRNSKNPLTNPRECAIIKAQRDRGDADDASALIILSPTSEKKLKKGLDKSNSLCYNKNVKRKTSYR